MITTITDNNTRFTHQHIKGFGWENTIYLPSDFSSVELLGVNDKDSKIFLVINQYGTKHVLKGGDRYGSN